MIAEIRSFTGHPLIFLRTHRALRHVAEIDLSIAKRHARQKNCLTNEGVEVLHFAMDRLQARGAAEDVADSNDGTSQPLKDQPQPSTTTWLYVHHVNLPQ